MADVWYYVAGADQKGPVSAENIAALFKAGVVSVDTLVWTQKLPGWTPIKETSLASLLAIPAVSSAPPPFPAAGRVPVSVGGQPAFAPVNASSNNFTGAVRTCFRKFVTWQGRAARPEFWWFFLLNFSVSIVAAILDIGIFGVQQGHASLFGPLTSIVFLLPGLAASVRRLHDTDRSAWWLLISLVPLAGIIVLIVFYCKQGTRGPNRYGEPTDLASVAEVF